MRILIYDVETAQGTNIGSICSVGWILLNNDAIIDQGYSLINPLCSFSSTNTKIHGICSEDVKNAPCFGEYWESTLRPLMTSSLVVAHSANFDMSSTEQALYTAKLDDPGIDYLDTMPVFKTLITTSSYKLTDLASLAGYEYNAHNAGEDVKALLHVLFYVRDLWGFEDLAAMFLRTTARAENTKTNSYIPKEIKLVSAPRFDPYTHCTEEVQTVDCRLQGMKICVTGDIEGYERSDIERMILEHGGKPSSGVSGKTDILIVGTYVDPKVGQAVMTSKHKKAQELIDMGGKIRIIYPEEFFNMVRINESDK